MKVLFAVNNENISNLIVKKYQNEYKEIISFKNVYYFNAILKEIQKDKSYDRIVISEDLEQFTNNNYQQMDKFIFDRLDSISDEASNMQGEDIPIILICSERRVKGEETLVKLFGIGIYNALIGKDRETNEVCQLIHKPRSKKEAKEYYKIDSDDVNYQSESENEVSEIELQNILAHYKRLGKNEERYIESFDNIALQYNDIQLKIICKYLPLNVRAVLEEKSPKYQKIMAFNKSVSGALKNKEKQQPSTSEKLLITPNSKPALTRPVVIPKTVKTGKAEKLTRPEAKTKQIPSEFENILNEETSKSILKQPKVEKQGIPAEGPKVENETELVEETVVKRGRGRPPKKIIEEEPKSDPKTEPEEIEEKPKRGRGRPPKKVEEIQELPGFDDLDEIVNEETKQEEIDNILPFEEDIVEEEEIELPGFVEEDEDEIEETELPGFDEEENEEENAGLPGFDDEAEDDNLPGIKYEENNEEEEEESFAPIENYSNHQEKYIENPFEMLDKQEQTMPTTIEDYDTNDIDISSLLASDKKIVTVVGTSKNGTSFILNNLAELLSSQGINVAILDATQNRNSYYIYTKNEENLRRIAYESIENLSNGIAKGIKVNNNLTVYTSLPSETDEINKVGPILETLLMNHSLILIDCDFKTPLEYFANAQEMYLVQTMDVLTIQPLTAFLKELKSKNILDESKIKIIINKFVKIRNISERVIIGGMSSYNDPAMSFMTELFNRNSVKYFTIPFENEIYAKYLEGLINCDISLKGYSKTFMQILKQLGNSVYPLISGKSSYKSQTPKYQSNFSPNINNTLNQMKKNY